jgi:ABC-type lipoprotein release transport system permease subunit
MGLQMNFVPQVRVNLWLPVIIIIVILLISFLLLFIFTYLVLREDKQVALQKGKKKEKNLVPRKAKVKKMMFGRVRPITLKFALVSLKRSPGRSFIVPVISLILSVFIIFLGLLSSMHQEKLNTVYDRIPVNAYMTSFKDETRDIGGLNLQFDIYRLIDPEYSYRMTWDMEMNEDYAKNGEYTALRAQEERNKILADSQYIEEMYLYSEMHYEYMGISKTKEGEEDKDLSRVPNVREHSNAYGFDWFLSKMNKMPRLAYADDLRHTPDFSDESEPEVEFLEGYSYTSLRLGENIGIISQNLATTYSVENGDTIRITAWINNEALAACSVIDIMVVGIYEEEWRTDTIYIPWVMSYDHDFYVDYNYPIGNDNNESDLIWNELFPRNVGEATFTLENTEELSNYRDYLETAGYSQVGKISKNRRAIVIQDKHLVETVQNLKNHIRLIDTIMPIMLILFGIIGFAVSYILIKHRMNEFAIMRSMGAKKRHVFFSFFLEQLILFMIGLIPAVAYAIILPNKIVLYGVPLVYFVLCYLTGTALALIVMNRAKILDVLFTKE